MISILKKINKCIYTGEKYHILFFCEDNVNLDVICRLQAVDDYFHKDDYLKNNKIIGFCNIHKLNKIHIYDDKLKKDNTIKKLIYYPSSVYIREDYRKTGTGTMLYEEMLSCIKLIHGKNKIKYPHFVQHEIAEEWATTSVYSKKIYDKLLNNKFIYKYEKNYPNGWYQINFNKINSDNYYHLIDRKLIMRKL